MAPLSRDSLLRIGVFLVTVVVVVAGTSAAPLLSDREIQQQDHPAFESGLVPDRAQSDGEITLDPVEGEGTVVIDEGHGNRFDQDEIQPLVEAITSAGYSVEFVESSTSINAAVKGADGLVIIDPGLEYTRSEVNAVERFVDSGGRLVLIGEPPRSKLSGTGFSISIRTIRSQLDTLASAFGIEFGESHVFNIKENDGNFRNVFAQSRGDSFLVDGVERTAFYTATPVTVRNGRTILRTVEGTRLDRGDTADRYPVAVRSGNVVAVGDKTFLSEDNFNVVDNERFIENLAMFLVTSNYRRTLVDYPVIGKESQTLRYTKVRFFDPVKRIANDLRAEGIETTLSLRRGSRASNGADVLFTTYTYIESNNIGTDSITVSDGRVAVTGYESNTTGVILMHAPPQGPDLVVVVDGPSRARKAAELLENGEFEKYLINDRTAVFRTASA